MKEHPSLQLKKEETPVIVKPTREWEKLAEQALKRVVTRKLRETHKANNLKTVLNEQIDKFTAISAQLDEIKAILEKASENVDLEHEVLVNLKERLGR